MNKNVTAGVLLATISTIVSMEHTSDVKKTHVDLVKIQSMCTVIYQQVQQDQFKPEVLVGITRGGTVPLGLLSGERMFDNRNVRMISVASYDGQNKQKELKLLAPIHVKDYEQFNSILVVDDIVDTGHTMEYVLNSLRGYLPGAIIKSAALFYKNKSCLMPDYYVEETSDWIVFPWEK